jgi:hypothetical protein
VQSLWKLVWNLLQKGDRELAYDPKIPLLDLYLKEWKSAYDRNIHAPMLVATLFTIAPLWNQPRCPTANDG